MSGDAGDDDALTQQLGVYKLRNLTGNTVGYAKHSYLFIKGIIWGYFKQPTILFLENIVQ